MLDRKGKLRASSDVSPYTAAGSRFAYPLRHRLVFLCEIFSRAHVRGTRAGSQVLTLGYEL
jgi:hypothetical protein